MKPTNGSVIAKCCGGKEDGESIELVPMGSIGPPARIQFVNGWDDEKRSARYSTYEAWPILSVWPEERVEVRYGFIGNTI